MSQQSLYIEKRNSQQVTALSLKQLDYEPEQQQYSSNDDRHQLQAKLPYYKHRSSNNQIQYESEYLSQQQYQQGRNITNYQQRNDRSRNTNNTYQNKKQNNDNSSSGGNGNFISQSQNNQHYQAGAYNQRQTQSNGNSEVNSNVSSNNVKNQSNYVNNESLPLNNYPQNINAGHYNTGVNKGNGYNQKNNGSNYNNQYATNNGKNNYQQQQGKNSSLNNRSAGGNQQVGQQNQKDKVVYQKKCEIQQNSGNSNSQNLPQLEEQRLSSGKKQDSLNGNEDIIISDHCGDRKELNGSEANCLAQDQQSKEIQLLTVEELEKRMEIENKRLAEVTNHDIVENGVQNDVRKQTEGIDYKHNLAEVNCNNTNQREKTDDKCDENEKKELALFQDDQAEISEKGVFEQTVIDYQNQEQHKSEGNDQEHYDLVEFKSEWVIWICFSSDQAQQSHGFLNEQTFLQNNQALLSFKTLRQLGLILSYTRFSHLSDFFTFRNTPTFQFASKQDSPYRQIDAVCFFKKGIKPIWEDERNSYGQDIQAKFTKASVEQIDEIYYFFISTVFSEEFPYHSQMNGFRFADKGKNTKKCGVRLEIWFDEISKEESNNIYDYFRNLLEQKWFNPVLKWEEHNKKVSQKNYLQYF